MTKLTREDILKLAQLARLDLSEDEVLTYQHELAEILAYVDLLQTVDVENLLPTNQVTGLTNVRRDDNITEFSYTCNNRASLFIIPYLVDISSATTLFERRDTAF